MTSQTASITDLLDRADEHIQEGEHTKAIQLYRRAQSLAPFRQDIRQLIAECLDIQLSGGAIAGSDFGNGDFEETRRARNRRNSPGGIPFNLTLIVMATGLVLAILLFTLLRGLGNRGGDEISGFAPTTEESTDRGIPDMAISDSGNSPELLIDEARGLIENDDFNDALAVLEEARALGGDDEVIAPMLSEVHLERGRALWSDSRFNRAKRECELAIEINPENSEAYYSLGWCLYSLAQASRNSRDETSAVRLYSDALDAFNESLGLEPSMAKSQWGLAQVHIRLGDRERAFEAAQETIRLDPSGEKANNARNMLRSHGMPLPSM